MTEAFGAEKGGAASSYAIEDGSLVARTSSVGNGRSEICWAVITPDDRFAFTTNFADGAVSRYAIASDGSLSLEDATAGISVDGMPGCATRTSPATGGSSTRSTPTVAASTAGRSTPRARSSR